MDNLWRIDVRDGVASPLFIAARWITLREWDLAREKEGFSRWFPFGRKERRRRRAYEVGMERTGSRRNDIAGNNDNRDDNRIIVGSDPARTMCYSSFRGGPARVLATNVWKEGVGERRGSGRWSFKLRRRNRWNEIEMHSPRSRPLRRPPGLFPVYSSRSLSRRREGRARKERPRRRGEGRKFAPTDLQTANFRTNI